MERYKIGPDAAVYFVTYSVVQWLPVFVAREACQIATDSLAFCHREKNLRINAYVIMPTHLHMIAFDADCDSQRLARTLVAFRMFAGRRLVEHCERCAPPSFLEVFQSAAIADRKHRFWQPSKHPEAIVSQPFWLTKRNYLHENPCRKGLVQRPEHWRFSSAAWHSSDGAAASDVPLTALAWLRRDRGGQRRVAGSGDRPQRARRETGHSAEEWPGRETGHCAVRASRFEGSVPTLTRSVSEDRIQSWPSRGKILAYASG